MNPSPAAVEETRSTLKVRRRCFIVAQMSRSRHIDMVAFTGQFAQRVKKVVLKATVNEVVDDKTLIFKYRAEVS